MRTVVRLTDAEDWPRHSPRCAKVKRAVWQRWRGREIEIELPPIKPKTWTCGTPFLWRVVGATAREAALDAGRPGAADVESVLAYVCIHQAQLD